jgi:hypothetical protein
MSQFAGKERYFAGVITSAMAYEKDNLRREIDTNQLLK